jgi:hypothetical protein
MGGYVSVTRTIGARLSHFGSGKSVGVTFAGYQEVIHRHFSIFERTHSFPKPPPSGPTATRSHRYLAYTSMMSVQRHYQGGGILPPYPTKQDINPPHPITHPGLSNVPDTVTKRTIVQYRITKYPLSYRSVPWSFISTI